MGSDELTLRVLGDIRDGIRGTNERLDVTNSRLDAAISMFFALLLPHRDNRMFR